MSTTKPIRNPVQLKVSEFVILGRIPGLMALPSGKGKAMLSGDFTDPCSLTLTLQVIENERVSFCTSSF